MTEYVILIAFPPQNLLHERTSLLLNTYIACVVTFIFLDRKMDDKIFRTSGILWVQSSEFILDLLLTFPNIWTLPHIACLYVVIEPCIVFKRDEHACSQHLLPDRLPYKLLMVPCLHVNNLYYQCERQTTKLRNVGFFIWLWEVPSLLPNAPAEAPPPACRTTEGPLSLLLGHLFIYCGSPNLKFSTLLSDSWVPE